jgi:putative hydrolase of HD superfamily
MSKQHAGIVAFFGMVERLKTIKRTGWVNCGVRNPESIADHMYRCGALAAAYRNDRSSTCH